MKIQTWLSESTSLLEAVGIESARLDSYLLLENELNVDKSWLLAHDNDLIGQQQLAKLNNKLTQRKNHTPLAYIIGLKEFYGRTFLVNDHVLIPRPESESIVELLLSISDIAASTILLDVGTGSGVLAVTAQLERPELTVVATDISIDALKLAEHNANVLRAPVQFYSSDLLDLPKAVQPDIILANLPYVPSDLITSEEIRKEPASALFSGIDGLDHYRIFWAQVINLDHKPTHIITESLETQHKELTQLASNAGYALKATDTLAQLFTRN